MRLRSSEGIFVSVLRLTVGVVRRAPVAMRSAVFCMDSSRFKLFEDM